MAINASALRAAVAATFEEVPFRHTSEELCFVCPEPTCGDKSGNRSVNLKTGRTNCWRCGKGGPIEKWARRLGFQLALEVEDTDLDTSMRELETLEHQLNARRVAPAYVSDIKLPAGFTPLSKETKGTYAKYIARMAKRKNLDLQTFIDAGAGFTRKGIWEPFCIFPVMEWGRLVYYQGRTYSEEPGEKTKKFPSRQECPLGSRHWVYNLDAVRERKARRVIVVESILNVKSLEKELERRDVRGVVPVCIFKHQISKEQAAKIAAVRTLEEVNLMFDEDATLAAYESAGRHSCLDLNRITVTEMPFKVDANDDAREAVRRWHRRRAVTSRAGSASAMLRVLDQL